MIASEDARLHRAQRRRMGRAREGLGDATSSAEARAEQANARAPGGAARSAGAARRRAAPKVVGGSTITQQLAKNLFLSGERNLLRKGRSSSLTCMLEALLGKQRILEIYLNSVEWGEGVFGAEAAARHYFRVGARAARRRAGGAAGGDAAGAQALREAARLALRRRPRRRPSPRAWAASSCRERAARRDRQNRPDEHGHARPPRSPPAAARLVVEEGMEYGPAKRTRGARCSAAHACARPSCPATTSSRTKCAPTSRCSAPTRSRAELAALRELALHWMERLAAVPPAPDRRGLARHRDAAATTIRLELFCDDSKAAEIGADRPAASTTRWRATPGPRGQPVDVLQRAGAERRRSASASTVHLTVLDHDDLRGALKPDARGRSAARRPAAALRRLMAADA